MVDDGQTFTNTIVTNTPVSPFGNGVEASCNVNQNIISKPCDGLVLSENAMDFPAQTHAPILMPGKLDHQQMRNAEGSRFVLNALFNGDYGNGDSDFFFTREVE